MPSAYLNYNSLPRRYLITTPKTRKGYGTCQYSLSCMSPYRDGTFNRADSRRTESIRPGSVVPLEKVTEQDGINLSTCLWGGSPDL